ncbi:hypothetical protein [Nostoc phage N1]|nr:hypothetical protein [Nostoc phage N1]
MSNEYQRIKALKIALDSSTEIMIQLRIVNSRGIPNETLKAIEQQQRILTSALKAELDFCQERFEENL